ncbi:hypothetical protein L249_1620 [Ophiocordyceps polyrhachis-furcata BCC 54312]|uniref:YEATS domain-containing protein n=1 Tax=Ophiocordyceps polyrhachis-furcata BCC 54312 TaxID=1330021 RepID=A0A367KZH4_9HYPO|nr:hypothetical protein L249_1620 [Ophiocordyceps polyrhachis-furcata BCC 54312]
MPARVRLSSKKSSNALKRKVKVVTEQHKIDKPSPPEAQDFPQREWSIRLYLLDEEGNERPADVFTKVVYNLHPTFANPTQSRSAPHPPRASCEWAAFVKPPFACVNEGWGEFEILIECYTTEKTKLAPILHDLTFHSESYEGVHNVTFKNPSQALQERLRETGPLPTDEDRPKKKNAAAKRGAQKFDYEKIAEALEKLEEEDLLRVVQLINDNKGPDTYIKSDVDVDVLLEAGEFSIDLYTMPDVLTTKLWELLSKKGLVS